MMSRYPLRRRTLAALLTIGFTVGASGCEREPIEEPATPQPHAVYQQPPQDLCERARFEDVLRRLEFSVPTADERGTDNQASEFRWYVNCGFAGVAEDGRFGTAFGDFGATGAVSLSVYFEVEDAVDNYDQLARGRIEHHAERVPGASTAEVTGWWHTGVSLELPEELDPDNYTLGDFEVTSVGVEWLVRHENLVANVYARGLAPTDDSAEAAAVLHDVVAAMLDESVDHLTLTE